MQLLQEEYVDTRLTRLGQHRGKPAAFGAVDVVCCDTDRPFTWVSKCGVKGESGAWRVGRVAVYCAQLSDQGRRALWMEEEARRAVQAAPRDFLVGMEVATDRALVVDPCAGKKNF